MGRRPAQAGCWQCHPLGPFACQHARARLAVAVETVLFWHPFCSACRSGIAAHGQSATTPPDPQLQFPTPGCCTRLPLQQCLLNSALAANTSAAAVVCWAAIFWEHSLCEAKCSGQNVGCCAAVVGTCALRRTTPALPACRFSLAMPWRRLSMTRPAAGAQPCCRPQPASCCCVQPQSCRSQLCGVRRCRRWTTRTVTPRDSPRRCHSCVAAQPQQTFELLLPPQPAVLLLRLATQAPHHPAEAQTGRELH